MIDTHCHILPGLDDGAPSLEVAVEMARYAAMEGVHSMIATPHHGCGRYDNPAKQIGLAVQELNAELQKQQIPIEILPGQEVRVYKELLNDWEAGEIRTLNDSNYLLLELPLGDIPTYFDDLLYEVHVLGLTVILAHPERNQVLMSNPNRLHHYLEQGCRFQVTSQSITGLFGRKVQKFAIHLCKTNMSHLIASDAHNMASRRSDLSMALAYLDKQIGPKAVENYLLNAACVVQNEPIPIVPQAYQRRFWSFK
ncbi:hypothetical protein A8709_04785 [Paenibacillus pectinilyticus]|uniref:Tyrosine-protein phosphatase n=1 Tax=Paenibacillus pectinilyticus TaxID=512399 RepID=A0A1C0ZTY2_9BACL|nr:hypothetical protein A8709_04785 [Paenibacillus pectinilyticus]